MRMERNDHLHYDLWNTHVGKHADTSACGLVIDMLRSEWPLVIVVQFLKLNALVHKEFQINK